MAKGRKLTISRSERYIGSYAGHNYANGESDSHELREEDVWSMVDGAGAGTGVEYYENDEDESAWESRATVHAPPIPRRDRQVGGLTLAFEESGGMTTSSRIVHQLRPQDGYTAEAAPPPRRQRQIASSAPVNVPDWRKILRVNSVESMNESDDGGFEECNSVVDPPHEFLARSRKKDSTSVFEGVGRTLKGRDLRRLRDTVWSQTGFDG